MEILPSMCRVGAVQGDKTHKSKPLDLRDACFDFLPQRVQGAGWSEEEF